jgi:hypothetical protein
MAMKAWVFGNLREKTKSRKGYSLEILSVVTKKEKG